MYAKFLIGLGVAMLILSGGLFTIAWSVAKKARSEWFSLATEWSQSTDFRDAVNTARKELTERLILEMHNEIDRRIDLHNDRDNKDAHRGAILHTLRNELLDDLMGRINRLTERVDKLERRRSSR